MLYAMTSTQCAGAAGSHAGHAMLSLAVANLPGPGALPPVGFFTWRTGAPIIRPRWGGAVRGGDSEILLHAAGAE